MKTILIRGDGTTPDSLYVGEAPRPETGRGNVLIRTKYAGVNRPDILQRKGKYPPPAGAAPGLGLEVSGVIETMDVDADSGWHPGDEVCALVNGGGYSEFVSVDVRHLLPIPRGLTLREAATLPEIVLTVYANLMEHGALQPGETVLVHGGNSGIGSMTIQMGKAFGAQVIATARGRDKCDFAKRMGADLVIDTEAGDFVEPVKAFGGCDVVIDIIGGDYVGRNLVCLKTRGRIVQVGFSKESTIELDLRRIMQKFAVLTGSMLRPRTADEKARLTAAVRERVWPLIEGGKIKAVIDREFAFADAAAAHAYLDSGAHAGKVVLKL